MAGLVICLVCDCTADSKQCQVNLQNIQEYMRSYFSDWWNRSETPNSATFMSRKLGAPYAQSPTIDEDPPSSGNPHRTMRNISRKRVMTSTFMIG